MKTPLSALKLDRRRAAVLLGALLLYAAGLASFALFVGRSASAGEAERQRLIAASPVVHVAPYGHRYHEYRHYGRLSSPLSLYEATERQYERCPVCQPPPPASVLPPPAWYVSHPLAGAVFFSWLYLVLTLGALLVIGRWGAGVKGRPRRA